MTTLKQAAQDVVDHSQLIVFEGCCNATMPADYIDELRSALQADHIVDANKMVQSEPVGELRDYDLKPMNTPAPPSVDALIAEIESVVKCAETATDGDTGDTIYIGEAYPEDEIKAILDKYRGKP